MINSVSNISFKAILLIPEYPKLSHNQEKVVNDIRGKLSKEGNENYFLIEPKKNESVELLKVKDVVEIVSDGKRGVSYRDPLFIGKYNEANPFKIEDYKNAQKKEKLRWLDSAIGLCMFLAIGFGFGRFFANRNLISSSQTEKATTVVKDSVQNVAKDTLQLFK